MNPVVRLINVQPGGFFWIRKDVRDVGAGGSATLRLEVIKSFLKLSGREIL